MTDKQAVAPTVEVYDRDSLVNLVNWMGEMAREYDHLEKYPELATRESRRQVLERLGLTSKTGTDYRLAIYSDATQTVMLMGTQTAEGEMQFTRSIAVPDDKRATGGDVAAFLRQPLKSLPETISLPAAKMQINEDRKPGRGLGTMRLDKDTEAELTTRVTLIALASEALNGRAQHASGNPSSLPSLRPSTTGRAV